MTSGSSVDGRRSGGSRSTTRLSTAIRPARTWSSSATAVNILANEASPKRVAGVTGSPEARLASP